MASTYTSNASAAPVSIRDIDVRLLPAHMQRVYQEHAELKLKGVALAAFITKNGLFTTLVGEEQFDLRDQLSYMDKYREVLERRLVRAWKALDAAAPQA
ncbi:hypothetical protein [Burkholderia phage BCSR5]|nr:hypothetical protein [Burkholderia phage BCSR5]